MGLELKLSKCEVIFVSSSSSADLGSLFLHRILHDQHGRDRVARDGSFEFLGAPIGNDDFCANVTSQRVAEAAKTIAAIGKHTDLHIGLRIFRAFAGFCKLIYSVHIIAPTLTWWNSVALTRWSAKLCLTSRFSTRTTRNGMKPPAASTPKGWACVRLLTTV